MEQEQLTSVIESILFVSDRPVTLTRLVEVLGAEVVSEQEISSLIETIKAKYTDSLSGFELREAQGGFHFCTKAANSEWIRRFLQTKPFRLGRSALETLSIIAYRQPITRAEIDKVRGIDSSHLMRTLIERGLVKMAGKADVPGRPVQYATTPRFLEVTGLQTISELPPLSELEQLQGTADDSTKPMEDGLERFIQDTPTPAEVFEDTQGLEEIDTLIQSAQRADKEIHESPIHAEVAQENEAALEGFLAFQKPFRKPRKVAAESNEEVVEVAEVEREVTEIDVEMEVTETVEIEAAPEPEAEAAPEVEASPEIEPPAAEEPAHEISN